MTSPTILIVEDHALLRGSLRDWLATMFDPCHIIEAGSGLEAIELVQKHQPEVIIIDLEMPQMNGFEATQRIKATWPDTQVMMLTVYENQTHCPDTTTAGADAYVLKSELESELVPTLQTLLAEQGRS